MSSQTEQHRLARREAALLPWIADPLKEFFHHEHRHQHAHGHTHVAQVEDKAGTTSPVSHDAADHSAEEEEIEAEEAAPSELFYDLFFVANLTTVTAVHYVTDYQSMVSYILFFIILWFTWLQTSLYDIRFSADSVFERGIKILHFAVMIGFAATTLAWNPLSPKANNARLNLESMSLTLMGSRLCLGVQYGVTALYAKRHQKGILQFLVHSLVMFAAAFGYLGMYFSFRSTGSTSSYPAWYAIMIVEGAVVMGTPTFWTEIGFKRTHLIERMSLLTLIVFGEGIIVMLKAVNAVEKGSSYGAGWSGSTFAVVGASIVIIYFFYMFYFDHAPPKAQYSSVRQEIWTLLHFPFHLAIVLAVEGLRQMTTLWSYLESYQVLFSRIQHPPGNTSQEVLLTIVAEMRKFFTFIYDDGTSSTVVKNYSKINGLLTNLTKVPIEQWGPAQTDESNWVNYYFAVGHSEYFGIKSPKVKAGATLLEIIGPTGNYNAPVEQLYQLVFEYFFIALGVIFFMYAVMGFVVRQRKDLWDWFALGLRIAIGLTFVLMERIQANPTAYYNFINTYWPIPTVCLIMFATLVVDKVTGLFAYKRTKAASGI